MKNLPSVRYKGGAWSLFNYPTLNKFQQRLFIGIIFLLLVTGCATPKEKGTASQQANPERWNKSKLIMLPVIDAAEALGAETSVRNPITKQVYLTGLPNPGAADMITAYFVESLRRISDVQIKQLTGYVLTWKRGAERKTAIELARTQGADGIFVGYLYFFRERQGQKYSVVEPAAVAFDMALLDARSGRLVWHADFVETQKALSENLLSIGDFVKRGGRWLTAKELVKDGIKKMLNSFPGRRR